MPNKEPKLDKETIDTRIYTYWMGAFKRAGKDMPVDHWEAANNRYSAKGEKGGEEYTDKPVVNDLRNHVEISRAYLDQRDPSFKVAVSDAYAGDDDAEGAAEAERKYIEYVWREQECQVAESQKLDSALLFNVGYTMPVFDLKKWMPDVRYLPTKDVRIDPDAGGLMTRASWMAYREDISIETLMADVPDITEDEIATIRKTNSSVLSEDEQKDVDDGDKELYLSVTRWHVFARNDAAVRDFTKEDPQEEIESVSLVDELKLKTERRYLQFVDGIPRPLKDKKKWPFELDHKEFPITRFSLNQVPESLYGFTDYQQMQRMDTMADTMMAYIQKNAFHAAITKYLASKEADFTQADVDNFINNTERAVLLNMIDEAGKPLLTEVRVESANEALVKFYELFSDESKNASGDTELAIESVADYKEVTAIGVRADLERRQQRSSLRLSGPRGYEKSIQEDAVKMLEIAHQFVPKMSVIEMRGVEPEETEPVTMDEAFSPEKPEFDPTASRLVELPWPQAQLAMKAGGHLLKLGIDAIVGEELAQFWLTTDEMTMEAIRLSTRISIEPGSTRNLTQEQQAASMMELYTNVLFPTIYEPMGRFDLASKFLEKAGELMPGLDNIEDFLPTADDVKQFQDQQAQAAQAEQQQAQQEAEQQAEIEAAKAEQDLEAGGQKVDNEQRSADIAVQKQVAKGQLEIQQQTFKNRMAEKQAKATSKDK